MADTIATLRADVEVNVDEKQIESAVNKIAGDLDNNNKIQQSVNNISKQIIKGLAKTGTRISEDDASMVENLINETSKNLIKDASKIEGTTTGLSKQIMGRLNTAIGDSLLKSGVREKYENYVRETLKSSLPYLKEGSKELDTAVKNAMSTFDSNTKEAYKKQQKTRKANDKQKLADEKETKEAELDLQRHYNEESNALESAKSIGEKLQAQTNYERSYQAGQDALSAFTGSEFDAYMEKYNLFLKVNKKTGQTFVEMKSKASIAFAAIGKFAQSAASKIKSAFQNVKNFFSKLMSGLRKLFADFYIFKNIISSIEDFIDTGSGAVEYARSADLAFGEASESVKEFAKNLTGTYGISEEEGLKYLSYFGTIGKQYGYSDTQNAYLAEQLTKFAGDYAEARELDVSSVVTALKGVFTGQTRGLTNIGINVASDAMEDYAKQLGYSYNTLSASDQSWLRISYILRNSDIYMGEFSKRTDTWAYQIRVASALITNIKQELSQALIQILTPIMKIVNNILVKIWGIAMAINELTGNKYGTQELTSSVADTSDAYDILTDSITDASNAAKKSLMGFDEINQLSDNSSDSSSSSALDFNTLFGDDSLDTSSLTDDLRKQAELFSQQILPKVQTFLEIVEKILKHWKLILGVLLVIKGLKFLNSLFGANGLLGAGSVIGKLITGGGLKKLFSGGIFSKLSAGGGLGLNLAGITVGFAGVTEVISAIGGIGDGITNFINRTPDEKTIGTFFKDLNDGFNDSIDNNFFTKLVTWLSTGLINLINGLLKAIFGVDILDKLRTGIAEADEFLQNWYDNDFKPWLDNVKKWFDELPDKVKNFVEEKIETIKNWFIDTKEKIKEWFEEKKEDIKTWFGEKFDAIKTWISEIPQKISDAISTIIQKILDKLSDIKIIIGNAIDIVDKIFDKIFGEGNIFTKIDDWFQSKTGLTGNTVQTSVPQLATGGYLKANTPRLIIAGDNTNEGEIVAPESKIEDAVVRALQNNNVNNGNNGNITIPIYLDGNELSRVIVRANERNNYRTGGRR